MITLAFGQMFFYFAISWPAYGGEDGLSIYVRKLPGPEHARFPSVLRDLLCMAAGCGAVLGDAVPVAFRAGLAWGAAECRAGTQRRHRSLQAAAYRVRHFRHDHRPGRRAFADLNRFVSPSMLSWQTSGEIMIFVILGGVGRHFGPLAGAALFILLEHNLGSVSEYWQFLLGLLLLLVVLFAHGGLIGVLTRRTRHD
jgi:branched-chain amino acid transport system permease protein